MRLKQRQKINNSHKLWCEKPSIMVLYNVKQIYAGFLYYADPFCE